MQTRSIPKVVALWGEEGGGGGRRRDQHPIMQIKNNDRNYRPRTTGASPWTKNNTESVQEVDTHRRGSRWDCVCVCVCVREGEGGIYCERDAVRHHKSVNACF